MQNKPLGRTIKRRREDLGLTAAEVAHLIGKTEQAYRKWEQGLNLESMKGLATLCAALDLSPNELITTKK
jgi:transcriptional regulator with XRE-family HTH domain